MDKFEICIEGERYGYRAIDIKKEGLEAIKFCRELQIEETNYIDIYGGINVVIPFELIEKNQLLQKVFSDINSTRITVPDGWCNDIFDIKKYYDSDKEIRQLDINKFIEKFTRDISIIARASKGTSDYEEFHSNFYKKFKNFKVEKSNISMSEEQKINKIELNNIENSNINVEMFYISIDGLHVPVVIFNSKKYEGFDKIKKFYYEFKEKIENNCKDYEQKSIIDTVTKTLDTFLTIEGNVLDSLIPNEFTKLLLENKTHLQKEGEDLFNNFKKEFAPKNIMWCLRVLQLIDRCSHNRCDIPNNAFTYFQAQCRGDHYYDLITVDYLDRKFAIPVPILAKILQVEDTEIRYSFKEVEVRDFTKFI